ILTRDRCRARRALRAPPLLAGGAVIPASEALAVEAGLLGRAGRTIAAPLGADAYHRAELLREAGVGGVRVDGAHLIVDVVERAEALAAARLAERAARHLGRVVGELAVVAVVADRALRILHPAGAHPHGATVDVADGVDLIDADPVPLLVAAEGIGLVVTV